MKVFLQNRDFRQLTINQWISTVGDTIFYLAFLNYVADASFAPLAILLITISETVPQVLQIFMGVLADFQHHRVLKYTVISFVKFVLYSMVALSLSGQSFSLWLVFFICLMNLLSDTLSYFSGAMLTPIFIRIIGKEHLTEAIGFKQSTVSLVRTISNILGGVLLGILSIQFISLLNALTFLIAFVGILFIKNDLLKVEKTISYQEGLSIKSFCQHLFQSSKLIWNMDRVIFILFIVSISQAVINVTVPISTLFFTKPTVFEFTNWSITRFVINTRIVSTYCRKPCKCLSEKYDFYKNSSIRFGRHPVTPSSRICHSSFWLDSAFQLLGCLHRRYTLS